eukprot:s1768_g10.t1
MLMRDHLNIKRATRPCRVLGLPLDVARHAAQAAISKKSPTPALREALRAAAVPKSGLFRGLAPALCCSSLSPLAFLLSYEVQRGSTEVLQAAMVAKAVQVAVVQPFDFLRVCRQAVVLLPEKQTRHLLRSPWEVASTEGLRSMWRGFIPTLLRDVPAAGCFWSSYMSLSAALLNEPFEEGPKAGPSLRDRPRHRRAPRGTLRCHGRAMAPAEWLCELCTEVLLDPVTLPCCGEFLGCQRQMGYQPFTPFEGTFLLGCRICQPFQFGAFALAFTLAFAFALEVCHLTKDIDPTFLLLQESKQAHPCQSSTVPVKPTWCQRTSLRLSLLKDWDGNLADIARERSSAHWRVGGPTSTCFDFAKTWEGCDVHKATCRPSGPLHPTFPRGQMSGVRFSRARPKRPKKDSPALEPCCSTRATVSILRGLP